MNFKHFIGIDVSKLTLDFTVMDQGTIVLQKEILNSKKGLRGFLTLLKKVEGFAMNSTIFCMEHTGIYNAIILDELYSRNAHIWLESALRIKQSQGILRGKSDKVDANRIANYAYVYRDQIRLWEPEREVVLKLKKLLTMRDRLVNAINQLKVPLKENKAFDSIAIAKIESAIFKAPIRELEKQLKSLEKLIQKSIQEDPRLNELFNLITSVGAVGTITAANVLVSTNEFKSINDPKKYACYCGVAPFEHQSGSSIRGRTRVSHLANKKIKTLLHLVAMTSIRMDGEIKEYYQRKVVEGKNKMCVINAIRNKIIHRIFAVVKRGSPYEKIHANMLA